MLKFNKDYHLILYQIGTIFSNSTHASFSFYAITLKRYGSQPGQYLIFDIEFKYNLKNNKNFYLRDLHINAIKT